MPYAIVIVPVAPLRATAAHKSEMISQLLWGEGVEVLETAAGGWVKVKNEYDGYIGWATAVHLETVDMSLLQEPATHYLSGWVNKVLVNGQPMMVPYGCLLKNGDRHTADWGTRHLEWEGQPEAIRQAAQADPAALKAAAFTFLNTAYLWGGRSVFGVDCSGFTQAVFKLMGIPLLRDAYQQATQGDTVDFLVEARLGDLAFFDNEEGRITHVGILLNDHEIIHAAGKVRVDAIDNQGIINVDTGLRTHSLRIIKRLLA
ncbi:C40 family peptidase [Chitinophaga nivalis]|uniref:C40 family peptidase n=1 Tax=Chitinophaga nivalis TaxID=2991709 RepID=A0ABT3IHM2_9BACT|nr:SH3 domain-containing C40 family peptidase [Chitinophaga nivalis]MCW3466883.1 C40 family peptidase [Chitinophaga nivalis]MCW3483426.1 C40 family peptidase [Chitinophaga nivalis]